MTPFGRSRRTLLRTAGLAVVAVAAAPLLAACGGMDPVVVRADVPRRPVPRERAADAATAGAAVGLDLIRAEAGDANFVCSPLSIVAAFGMVRNGAAGRTADEMDATLHLPPLAELNAGLNAVDASLESVNDAHAADDKAQRLQVRLTNAVWGQRGVAWKEPFLDTLATDYGTGVLETDFAADPERARAEVNDWVGELTAGKIPDLMPDGSVTADTVMVLANALYLKAIWLEELDQFIPTPFHGPAGSADVPMVHGVIPVAAGKGPGWVAARLPFRGGELAMTLVRPDHDLAALDETFDASALMQLLSSTPTEPVEVTLPKFSIRSKLDLKVVLSRLGMPTAFTDAADFSGLSAEVDCMIQEAVHQGFIALDETGVEAAAATGISVRETSGQAPPETKIVFDRPFFFCLHQVAPAVPLFVGVVNDPASIDA